MVDFIEEQWSKNENAKQIDIVRRYNNKLSKGTIINYLNELLQEKRISSYKNKNERFYTPPAIPFSLKLGLGLASFVSILCVLIDVFSSPRMVYDYVYMGLVDSPSKMENTSVSTLPILVYSLILIFFFTILTYSFERKLNKV